MKVLVACERSGVVRDAFARLGHDAWSCDLLPSENGGKHIQKDAAIVAYWRGKQKWDLMIAHPPCTYFSSSGLHRTVRGERPLEKTLEALEFVYELIDAPIRKVCIENPIGFLSRALREPDQIIQPHEFGEDASKATCLWLRNLPPLKGTKKIEPRMVNGLPRWANQTDSGQNKLGPSKDRWALRSRTYQGIADAMAQQWTANDEF